MNFHRVSFEETIIERRRFVDKFVEAKKRNFSIVTETKQHRTTKRIWKFQRSISFKFADRSSRWATLILERDSTLFSSNLVERRCSNWDFADCLIDNVEFDRPIEKQRDIEPAASIELDNRTNRDDRCRVSLCNFELLSSVENANCVSLNNDQNFERFRLELRN